ncbi:MAG: pimeloyl-ACP methyl ester esterase BioH [Methylobacillus sp.]|nr:pimeloyl-ACP methyl ester esterase BioH [Methylobacillus sp.]
MSLHIETAGQGKNIVLLHGWGMHGGVWDAVAGELAQNHCAHVIDLPGMGYSDPVAPYDLAHLADAVAEVIPENSTVIGWSLGGQIAIKLALNNPQHVNRLVLVDSTPCFVQSRDWQAGIAPEIFREFAAQVGDDYRETMTRFLGLQTFGGASSRIVLRDLKERFFTRPAPQPAVLRDALDILLTTDLREQLPRLQQPALLIHGSRDTLVPPDASRWMATQLPHARLMIINGASHAPFLSHPAVFMQTLREFFEETS